MTWFVSKYYSNNYEYLGFITSISQYLRITVIIIVTELSLYRKFLIKYLG